MHTKNNRINAKIFFFLVFLCASSFLMLTDAFARAGGGGGGGRGGGIVYIILLPYLIVHSIIVTFLLAKKHRECKQLLINLEKKDKAWQEEGIYDRVSEVFFTVQDAWTKRDQTIAKDCMSERLFRKHKMQTDQMLSEGKTNVLDRINLIESKIVEVADYNDDSKDKVWVYIKGSMIDCMRDDKTQRIISGNPDEPETFTELWKFIRNSNVWVLDEIDEDVKIGDLNQLHSFSEGK